MNSVDAFSQIDHPAIVFGQSMVAITLVALWVIVRHRPAPMPQLVLFFLLSVLANLAGRVAKAYWFSYADIIQYNIWWIVNGVWVASVLLQVAAKTGAGDENGRSGFLSSPVFSRTNRNLTAGFMAIVVGIFVFYVGNLYTDRIALSISATTAYARAYTKATQTSVEQQRRAQASRDSIAAELKDQKIKDSLWHEFVRKDRAEQLAALRDVKAQIKQSIQPSKSILPVRTTLIIPTITGKREATSPVDYSERVKAPSQKVIPKRVRQGKYGYEPADTNDTTTTVLAKYNNF